VRDVTRIFKVSRTLKYNLNYLFDQKMYTTKRIGDLVPKMTIYLPIAQIQNKISLKRVLSTLSQANNSLLPLRLYCLCYS
jgi:hypothetical protein